jgi:hypothetical protein
VISTSASHHEEHACLKFFFGTKLFLVSLAPFQETQDTYFILSGLLPGTEYKFEVNNNKT